MTSAERGAAGPPRPAWLRPGGGAAAELPSWWRAVAAELWRWARGAGWPEARCEGLAALGLALLLAQEDGHAALPLGRLQRWLQRLGEWGLPEQARRAAAALGDLAMREPAALAAVVGVGAPGGPVERRPLLLRGSGERTLLQSERAFALERRIAAAVAERLGGAGLLGLDEARLEQLARASADLGGGRRLGESQREALRRALSARFAVVSGGPGTGKTTVAAALLRAWVRARAEALDTGDEAAALRRAAAAVGLAAPTGKAADRMREALQQQLGALEAAPEVGALREALGEAATLHRLLGYSPRTDRFAHGPGRPLPHEIVLLDEASMLDLELAAALLQVVRPEAHLVLLGDADQLPAVGIGAVLRALDEAAARPDAPAPLRAAVVRLRENHRMRGTGGGAEVLRAAEAVRQGRAEALIERLRRVEAPEALQAEGAEWLAAGSAEPRHAFLRDWYARRIAAPCFEREGRPPFLAEAQAARRWLQRLSEQRLLAATRRGPGSVAEANALLGALHAERLGRIGAGGGLLEGAPALVVRNDYALGLFNGDLGVVLLSEGGSSARYHFVLERGGVLRSWPLRQVGRLLEPAWALTVHKAQGSEFRHVGVLLPERFGRPLGRELLYTALTRAREGAVLVGPEEVLRRAVEQAERRAGGLGEELHRALGAVAGP